MNTHGQQVIDFDNSLGTVKEFNEIFEFSKILDKEDTDMIEIGTIINDGTYTKRVLYVNGVQGHHTFYKYKHLFRKYSIGENDFSNLADISEFYNVGNLFVKKELKRGYFKDIPFVQNF